MNPFSIHSSSDLESSFRSLQEGCLSCTKRPRRNRSSEALRNLIAETNLLPQHLIIPYFIQELSHGKEEIASMPGVFRYSLEALFPAIEYQLSVGVQAVILFFHIDKSKKDWHGSEAYKKDGILYRSVEAIKKRFPEMLLIVDIALDPFTDHGLDGLIDSSFHVMNDPSVVALGHMALTAAQAGADMIAPSDMMDGRVSYLRQLLDRNGYSNVGILSYCVKYLSALYGPFREALQSAPQQGDKKSFQLSPRNGREALLESLLDDEESADLLMIKPAITALDVISNLRARVLKPIGAFQVSGEYAMIQAAHQRGWIDGEKVLLESLTAIRRAGADFIISYGAVDAATSLKKGMYV